MKTVVASPVWEKLGDRISDPCQIHAILHRPLFPAQKFRQVRQYCLIAILALLIGLLLHRSVQLYRAANRPVDAVLVLGGSIRREIAAAELARDNSHLPILISAGSPAPCVWSIFEREARASRSELGEMDPKAQTWLESCANSTLGNYRFSLPILQSWGAHHVQLMTSGTHQLRATGLGRIILGSHGIWLSPTPVAETGRPGNQESQLKTAVDWGRGLAWALISQFYGPQCNGLVRLDQVVLEDWVDRDFECEHQGEVDLPEMFKRP